MTTILKYVQNGLSNPNGVVRKATIAVLQVPKCWHRFRSRFNDCRATPPVLVNSFPKSGTHLLLQPLEGLPDRVNYGAFLASMTSSFQFRERSPQNAAKVIRRFTPGELVRGHLFYHPQTADALKAANVVHYFIYRDPRDVVVSEAHYLREMNRWHRLARFFRKRTIEEAITLSITGFDPPIPGLEYPNIAERFARYEGWLSNADCFCVKFEDLRSAECASIVKAAARFYLDRSGKKLVNEEELVKSMVGKIAPTKSHTFRSGKKKGWQTEFTAEHRKLFGKVAGDLLIRLNYEINDDWMRATADQSAIVAENSAS